MATWPCWQPLKIPSKFILFFTLTSFTWPGGAKSVTGGWVLHTRVDAWPFRSRRSWLHTFSVEFLCLVTVAGIQGPKFWKILLFTLKLPVPTCGSAGAGIKWASSLFYLFLPDLASWWFSECWICNQPHVHTCVCTAVKSLWRLRFSFPFFVKRFIQKVFSNHRQLHFFLQHGGVCRESLKGYSRLSLRAVCWHLHMQQHSTDIWAPAQWSLQSPSLVPLIINSTYHHSQCQCV